MRLILIYIFDYFLGVVFPNSTLVLPLFILFNFVNPVGENYLITYYISTSLVMSEVEHLQISVKHLCFFLCELPVPLFCVHDQCSPSRYIY